MKKCNFLWFITFITEKIDLKDTHKYFKINNVLFYTKNIGTVLYTIIIYIYICIRLGSDNVYIYDTYDIYIVHNVYNSND